MRKYFCRKKKSRKKKFKADLDRVMPFRTAATVLLTTIGLTPIAAERGPRDVQIETHVVN